MRKDGINRKRKAYIFAGRTARAISWIIFAAAAVVFVKGIFLRLPSGTGEAYAANEAGQVYSYALFLLFMAGGAAVRILSDSFLRKARRIQRDIRKAAERQNRKVQTFDLKEPA